MDLGYHAPAVVWNSKPRHPARHTLAAEVVGQHGRLNVLVDTICTGAHCVIGGGRGA